MNVPDAPSQSPSPEPVPLGRRIASGVFDLVCVLVLMALFLGIPLFTGGLAMPLWGSFASIAGYSVLPLVLFGQTPGMKLFGLRLVTAKDGAPPHLFDVLLRELIGRGYLPFGYLSTLLIAFIGSLLQLTDFETPVGVALLLFVPCLFAFSVATLGQALVLVTSERRSLADYVGRTRMVRAARASQSTRSEDDGEEVRMLAAQQRRRKVIGMVVGELALIALAGGVPVFTAKTSFSFRAEHAEDRARIDALQRKFDENPTDHEVAWEQSDALRRDGHAQEADAIVAKLNDAREEADDVREQSLRQRLEKNPGDEEASSDLMELLERADRVEDMKDVYRRWVLVKDTAERQSTYGVWLYHHDAPEEAVEVLRASLKGGFEDAETHECLGLALHALHRDDEARPELKRALELDPDSWEAKRELEAMTPVKKARGR